jgi:hypothetical protein
MSIAALELGNDVEVTNEDVIVGGGFTLSTGLYAMVVDNAYLDKSSKGAMSLNLHLKKKAGGNQVYRHTIYITSGDTKGNKPYYEKDGKKFPLPGYSLANQISQITADLPISQVTPEKKLVKLWDFEASAEVAREVPVLTEMVGQEILVGMQLVRENKRSKTATGEWVDTNEAREFNEIDKVFYPDGFTVTEKSGDAEEAVFVHKWEAANGEDYVRDKFKPVASAPAATGPAQASTAAAAPDDLFSD